MLIVKQYTDDLFHLMLLCNFYYIAALLMEKFIPVTLLFDPTPKISKISIIYNKSFKKNFKTQLLKIVLD